MGFTGRFIRLIQYKIRLILYLFFLTITCVSLLTIIVPAGDIVRGMIALADTNALSGVVSFAQWILAPEMLANTFIFIFTAPVPVALAYSLLLAGALGSFASGMEYACGFPAKAGMSIKTGYRTRFFPVMVLIYATLVIMLLAAVVWVIASAPLAVINELAGRGALSRVIYNATLAVTVFVIYIGSLFLRAVPLSFVPALYSGSRRPFAAALSFAGRNFFAVAKHMLVTDVLFIFILSLYNYFNKSAFVMTLGCMAAAILIFYLLFAAFDAYAADGYGFDEQDTNGTSY